MFVVELAVGESCLWLQEHRVAMDCIPSAIRGDFGCGWPCMVATESARGRTSRLQHGDVVGGHGVHGPRQPN